MKFLLLPTQWGEGYYLLIWVTTPPTRGKSNRYKLIFIIEISIICAFFPRGLMGKELQKFILFKLNHYIIPSEYSKKFFKTVAFLVLSPRSPAGGKERK
ncbi:MAG: hypothetical protein LBR79_03235 [Oscillospiraceae bacterium]|nr:hypothetical protein [Oscillospiraceae bacterium]